MNSCDLSPYQDLWAQIYSMIDDFIGTIPGYDRKIRPDIQDLCQHWRVVELKTDLKNGAEGTCQPHINKAGQYEKFTIRVRSRNVTLKRRDNYFLDAVIAHEIGHVFLFLNSEKITQLCKSHKILFDIKMVEKISDFFSDIFLLPTPMLCNACRDIFIKNSQNDETTVNKIKRLSDRLQVTTRQLLRRIHQTNALKESNYFFILAQYGYNPNKYDSRRWRCYPNYVLLPALVTPHRVNYPNFVSDGFHYAGIDALNLCDSSLARQLDWENIYENMPIQKEIELNPLGPRKGVTKNHFRISNNHDNIAEFLNFTGQNMIIKEVTNKNFMLYLDEISCFGWHAKLQENDNYMLICGKMNIRPRK